MVFVFLPCRCLPLPRYYRESGGSIEKQSWFVDSIGSWLRDVIAREQVADRLQNLQILHVPMS